MSSLKWLISRMEDLKKYFVLALFFVAAETGMEVIIPFLMADIIDVGIQNQDTHIFMVRGIQMIFCAFISLVFGLLYAKYAAKASSLLASKLRQDQFEKIQEFAFENLDDFETSGLVTRLSSDVNVIQNCITSGIRPIVRGPSMLFFGILMSFLINAKLAIIFFFILPILALILFLIVRRVAPMYPKLQSVVDALNGIVQENLIGIRVVKAFVKDEYEVAKFEKVNEELAALSAKSNHIALLNQPAFQFTMYAAIVILCAFGSKMIMSGIIQIGELTGVLSYVLQIMNSLMMISNVFLLLTRAWASMNRIQEVLDEEVTLKSGALKTLQNHDIEFKDVSFKYNVHAPEYVLEHINVRIEAGTTIGILGPTGSAKSSLVQLIPRLYDVNCGEVCIGGHNVKEYDLQFLRDQVGLVLQKNVLFSGSVIDNLRWGNENANMQDIEWACSIACVDEFIERLSDGYDTELGQGGINVSGGQKQRLCIARALLKKPKILIFDDSTSAVDTKTDQKIRKGLSSIKGLTQIIIAQRISSVRHCDQILILDDGKLQGIGNHDELLRHNEIYQQMYESQQRGGGLDE